MEIVSVVRFPLTLCATFIELSTIKKRSQAKSKEERQKAERDYALKVRSEMKLSANKTNLKTELESESKL